MKNKPWLVVNTLLLSLFIYIYVGVFACDKFPFYSSSESSFLFGCEFAYLLVLYYFYPIFWFVLTISGTIYYWRKRKLKDTLIISSWFFVLIILMFFAYPTYVITNDFIEQNRQEKFQKLELRKQQNTSGNYILQNCEDTLNAGGIIRLDCVIKVNFPGKYKIKGRLLAKDPRLTGFDETILETNSNEYVLNSINTHIEVPFEYLHVAKNKEIPNGPYVVELYVIPIENLAKQVKPFIFSGFENVTNFENYSYKENLVTTPYLGTTFEKLPYKKVVLP